MKALIINGLNADANLELAEAMGKELNRRRYTFAIWQQKKEGNHNNHGTTFLSSVKGSTDISWQRQMPLEDLLPHIQEDFLLLTFNYGNLPNIVYNMPAPAADELTFAAVNCPASNLPGFILPAQLGELMDFIVAKTPDLMPFPDGNPCCGLCGNKTCAGLLAKILNGTATSEDCLLKTDLQIKINGQELTMVKFVQDIILKSCLGMLSTLNGYRENSQIEIIINPRVKV